MRRMREKSPCERMRNDNIITFKPADMRRNEMTEEPRTQIKFFQHHMVNH
jgi:hypothetical protein